MHQRHALDERFDRLEKRRPESAGLDRGENLFFFPGVFQSREECFEVLPGVGDAPLTLNRAACIEHRDVTESQMKVYSNVDHAVPPLGRKFACTTILPPPRHGFFITSPKSSTESDQASRETASCTVAVTSR